jgi:hypothetical protein
MSARRITITSLCVVMAIAGCSEDGPMEPEYEIDGLVLTLAIADRDDDLAVDLQIRNRNSSAREVRFAGTCNPVTELYDPADDTTPVWREHSWREANGSCIPVGRNANLVPGGSVGTHHEVTDAVILGDSISGGEYRVVVVFAMTEPQALVELEGGTVSLR